MWVGGAWEEHHGSLSRGLKWSITICGVIVALFVPIGFTDTSAEGREVT